MADITWQDKQDRIVSALAAKFKWTAAEANEVRDAINAINGQLRTYVRAVVVLKITSANFTGGKYASPHFQGLTPDVHFQVFSDDGAGALLKEGAPVDGGSYTFNSSTNEITMDAGNYRILVNKPISI